MYACVRVCVRACVCACVRACVRVCVCVCVGVCPCIHLQCERCQALFNDKPWQAGNSTSLNACKQCTCNGHATSCAYNRSADTHPNSRLLGGGGVCACRDNTAGRNCDQCMRRFYRDPSKALSSPDVCLACNCMAAGVVDDGECVQVCCLPHNDDVGSCGGSHWTRRGGGGGVALFRFLNYSVMV